MGYFNITKSTGMSAPEEATTAERPNAGGFFNVKNGVRMNVPSGHMPVQGIKKMPISGPSAYNLQNLKFR